MPTTPLPERPSLEHLRRRARTLQRSVRGGDPGAIARVAEHHPEGAPAPAELARFPLSSAQLVVAREHGFASWARLKHHLDVVSTFTRVPDRVVETDRPADEFLRLACLVYGGDEGPDRWAAALAILHERPEIRASGIHVAAALADADAIERLVRADREAARREGGPHRWEPILYLAYSRVDPQVSEASVVTSARALLEAGADPNAGFLHSGLPTPFTALTGAFGEGERGPVRQPRHPQSVALARTLLDAGAEPNDGQSLYNRMFEPGNDHLELLFSYGLGRGSGGPWRERLGDVLDSPVEMLRAQLRWAVTRDLPARVRLLLGHGVDADAPFRDGRTAVDLAARHGNAEIVEALVGSGARPPALRASEALVGAALAGDRDAAERIVAAEPGSLPAARVEHPTAILEATTARRAEAVAALADLGFDVNARARPGEGFVVGVTALHHAASDGRIELCRLLLALGADRDATDDEHGATPLGWARYGGQAEVIELLESSDRPGAP